MITIMRGLLVLLLSIPFSGAAQDGVDYVGATDLREGLYRNFQDFRNNAPAVPLEKIRDDQGVAVTDLRRAGGKLYWQPDSGDRKALAMDKLWGFCQNDAVYISGGNGFYRIGLLGSLSHLMVEQTYQDWNSGMYGYPYGGVTRTVMVQQLLDMESAQFLDFSAAGMDQALQPDSILLEEFRNLPKKQRNSDEVLFRFLRMYNDRHPLTFPD
ncbi:MAG TPA: hypothetical protein PLB89_06955 [Flavobacteriales bacterium]|nr:hypothetical protein [Flavobacteriales bacterium]